MISFRYHIVSIVSVFLALAVGVALGGGPLKGEVDNTLVEQVKADRKAKAELQAQIRDLRNTNTFTDEFAEGVAPTTIGKTLEGRVVTLVVLPSAEQADIAGLAGMIDTANGTIGGTVRIGQAMLQVDNKQLVDELGQQLLEGASGVTVPEDASGYERAGALLARAIGTSEEAGGAPVDDTSDSILAGMSTAGLLSTDGDLTRRGSVVVFVAGEGRGDAAERQGANQIAGTLAVAVDAGTDGVVVAGPVESAREGGLVRSIRDNVVAARDVSTVDVVGRSAGRVVTVMALAGQAAGESGHYGAVDAADGALPGASPGG